MSDNDKKIQFLLTFFMNEKTNLFTFEIANGKRVKRWKNGHVALPFAVNVVLLFNLFVIGEMLGKNFTKIGPCNSTYPINSFKVNTFLEK